MLESNKIMKLYFILPVFNEQGVITKQLSAIDKMMKGIDKEYSVYIIDDYSSDQTCQELSDIRDKYPFKIIKHSENLGPGAAFKTGFREVMKVINDKDVVITMDADCTQSLRAIMMMLDKIKAGYEVVIGSCFAPGGMLIGVPFLRYIVTRLCNGLYKTFFPINGVTTFTGFFRCYSSSALKQAFEVFGDKLMESDGFPAVSELLIKMRQIPLFITEVPIILRYDLKKGKSKLCFFPTVREHLHVISKNLFKRRVL